MKKILILLNYYYPYISGVSEYARILAEELVKKGYDVTVLTSNHAKLQREEYINGVRVIRTPIICKISKGTISPSFFVNAIRLAKKSDVVNMHLPMIESGIISCGIKKEKIITTYHCDIHLPHTFLNKLITMCMDFSNRHCLSRSHFIAVQTVDYAKHSRVAYKFQNKFIEAATPIKDYARVGENNDFIKNENRTKVIGFCGRLVEEKGIDVLLKAYEILSKKGYNIILEIGGDYKNVAGGSVYPSLKTYIEEHKLKNVIFTGKIPEDKMEEFYSSLDVFVLPSINSLEAFGMVQIEAMLCGTPVVATDLYGVRTITAKTGMGVVVNRNNPESLAEGIAKILNHPEKYKKSKAEILQYYGTSKCVAVYEQAIEDCIHK